MLAGGRLLGTLILRGIALFPKAMALTFGLGCLTNPLANCARAVSAMGAPVRPEDMAFIVMTSHGGQDVFSLRFDAVRTNSVTAPEFAAMLKDSHIGPAVFVLSACDAGSSLNNIAAPDRLIIAAARADRTSFGNSNGLDGPNSGGRSLTRHCGRKPTRARPSLRRRWTSAGKKSGACAWPACRKCRKGRRLARCWRRSWLTGDPSRSEADLAPAHPAERQGKGKQQGGGGHDGRAGGGVLPKR